MRGWRLPGAAEGAEAGAEAEAGDALVKLDAATVLEAAEKFEEALRLSQTLLHFCDFAGGEFAPAGGDWRVFAEAVEEKLHFGEREIHFAGEADEQKAVEGVGGIATLAVDAVGRSEQTDLFVVADGGGVEVGAGGEFSDFHSFLPALQIRLDLKLTLTFSVVALIAAAGVGPLTAQSSTITGYGEKQVATTESKFYCNTKALTPAERARHKQLGDKLTAERKEVVVTEKGYEFQYSPKNVSVAELAEWVVAESKCCPFFDFHIDLENEGKLICLRLTGEEGIKAFIRAEFNVE